MHLRSDNYLQVEVHILKGLLKLSSKIVTDLSGLGVPSALPRTVQCVTDPHRLAVVQLLQVPLSNAYRYQQCTYIGYEIKLYKLLQPPAPTSSNLTLLQRS